MDLSVPQAIFRAIEENRLAKSQCGQTLNPILKTDVPESIVNNFKTILFNNPGKKVPEMFDTFADPKCPSFFFDIYNCLVHFYDVYKDDTMTKDDIVSLTKKLIDYTQDIPNGRLRLSRLRKYWPQVIRWCVIAQQDHHDFQRTQIRSRNELLHPDVLPKKLSFTVLHALACLCIEHIIEKPQNSFDNGLDESLQHSHVFENDLAIEKSIFETIQQDMDAFAQTFSCQVHAIASVTRTWVEALPDIKLQNLKMKFESKPANGPKDTGVIQRNFLTQLALMWYYCKEIDNCCSSKNFKTLYQKIVEDAACWAFTNSFLNCLDEFYKTKSFKMSLETQNAFSKHGEIIQQLVLRMSQIISHMQDNWTLREKFIALDHWTLRLSTSNPQHSIVYLQHTTPFIFWGFGPDQWTSLSMEQFGLDSLEGSTDVITDTFEKNHPFDNVMALMGICAAFTKTMEHLWVVLTDSGAWKARVKLLDSWKKDTEKAIEVPLLQVFPSGQLSKKPQWMLTREEMNQMRNEWKKTYNVLQLMKEEAILYEMS